MPTISADAETKSGTLEFAVGGDDVGTFFPVRVSFAAQGSLIGMGIGAVVRADTNEDVAYSQDVTLETDEYLVIWT